VRQKRSEAVTVRILDRVATPEEHAGLAASAGWEDHFDASGALGMHRRLSG
jgi:hypothetical protein